MNFLTAIKNLVCRENNGNALNYIEAIPKNIKDLLWFADSEYKNYEAPVKDRGQFISFMASDIEPSVIFTNLEVSAGTPDKLDYYPKYWDISPEQRYVYLNWLSDISKPIEIGYVFLFYYGLERHILQGNYKEAFETILELRKHHKNTSFMGYSQEILLYACIMYNDFNLFKKFIESTPKSDIEINNLYIACLKNANLGLTADEIISLASLVEFKNKRYIKEEYECFHSNLQKGLQEKFKRDTFDLSNYNFDLNNKTDFTMFANFAGDLHQIRHIKIPSMFDNNNFKEDVKVLLTNAHEATKKELKQRRKELNINNKD